MVTLPLVLSLWVSAARAEPRIIEPKEWGSTPGDMSAIARQPHPEWITIHHAGEYWTDARDPVRFLCDLQRWGKIPFDPKHPERTAPRKEVWPDLPYHFLIAPDGRIFAGRPVEYVPQTNTPDYQVAGNVNIELMGDFERQRPSVAQLESVAWLSAKISREYGIGLDHVRGHMDAAGGPAVTDCPGRDVHRYFDDGRLKGWISDYLERGRADVIPGEPLPQGPTEPIPTRLSHDRRPLKRCPAPVPSALESEALFQLRMQSSGAGFPPEGR